MSEDRQHKMLSLNSLPRLFGKKKAKKPGERVDHVVEGRGARVEENLIKGQQVNNTKVTSTKSLVVNSSQPTKGDQMVVTSTKSLVELPLSSGGSSSNQSMTTAYSEHSFNNENLYVNGQVPRGQFKEYFSVPALEHRLERLEAQTSLEENGPAKPRRSFILGPDSSFFSRNVTTRKSALSMQPQPSSLPIPVFERAGSERGSLRKARSVDDFVESAADRFEDTLNTLIGSPNTMGLPPKNIGDEEEDEKEEGEEETGECAYYNVQFARKARSSSQLQSLTQQSLRHHDSKQIAVTDSNYIQHLIKAQQRDPFGTSFLGHSLVTDKAEESMNTMVCDLDDNTLENSLIENQLDELDNTLLVNNNNGQESPKCEKQVLVEKNIVLPKSNNVLQSNFLQSTLINNTNTTLSLGNALKCNTISKINMIPLNNRSRKNILSHTNNLNMDSTYQVLQSTMVNKKEGLGDALSLDSGAGSLGPCSLLGPEQSAIGTQIDTPENIHFWGEILEHSDQSSIKKQIL